MTIVEKADSSSVLPSPLSISTKNRMTFLFANLKDRDFLVQRISDFLQQTTSKIYLERELTGSLTSSDDEVSHRRSHLKSTEKPSLMIDINLPPNRFTPSMGLSSPAARRTVWARRGSAPST